MSTQYGIFNDEGCIEANLWSKDQAEAALDLWVEEGEDREDLSIEALCPDHEEQPKDGCEECATDGDDEA